MKGSLKKFALTFSVLALMALDATAQCSGKTVYLQVPDDWSKTTVRYLADNPQSITPTQEGSWLVFKFQNFENDGSGKDFAFFKDAGVLDNNSRWISIAGYDESRTSRPGNASKFSCNSATFGNGDVVYISSDPTNPTKTVISTNPPNAKYFYFLPPNEENWIIGTPYYVYGSGNSLTKVKMQPDEKCGWFKLIYFGTDTPPDADGWIWLGSELKSDEDQIGILGVTEEMGDWVDAKPRPFNLSTQFGSEGGEKHLSFIADDGSWLPSMPTLEETNRCTYNFAAIIYDTDKSVNKSFTLNTDDAGTGGDQYGQWTAGIIKNMVKRTLNDEKKIECDQCAKGGTVATSNGYFTTEEEFRKAFDPNDDSNVRLCYDMPFTRTESGLWEFDSDKMLNHNGKTVGGFFPELLQNEVMQAAAEADYSKCPTCRSKHKAESFVGLHNDINPWCFERGLTTRNKTGQTLSACGAAYGPGAFAHGGEPADTWGATPTGSNDLWQEAWRNNAINMWGGSNSGASAEANPFFCFESHAEFTYEKGQEFFFRGDDDIWVYINKKLEIDLGGSHLAAPGYVELDKLGLTEGQKYPIDIFFCDRRTTMSNVRISTNMYFSQNTGLFVNGNVESSDAPICINKSGGGGCAAAVGGESGESRQCGDEIADKLRYYMQKRGNTSDINPEIALDVNNPNCTKNGSKLICYGGITIDTVNGTVHVDKSKLNSGGLSGTYFVYVAAANNAGWDPKPPDRQVTRVTFDSKMYAIWGNILYDGGGSISLPTALLNVRGGEQSTIAGKLVPIAFADGGWRDDVPDAFYVSDISAGQVVSISRNGLTNEDGTTELKIYRDEAGTQPVSLSESFEIPSNGVLVLWVTGNYEASEVFTYSINAASAGADPHKIKVRLPKLEFVEEGTTTPIKREQAFGSKPSLGGDRENRGVYMGTGLERTIAAFDPDDGSLCTTCNFPIKWSAWLTDEYDNRLADKPTDNGVIRADDAEIVNGVGQFTFRGFAEANGKSSTPVIYAALSVRGPSTLESTKAFWDGMVFAKPPVPTPKLVEIFDQDGDGKGDLLRIAYDRKFPTDSLPNGIEVFWDLSKSEPLRFGTGSFNGDGLWTREVSDEANRAFWTSGEQNNFSIRMDGDSIIVISGKVVDEDELGRGINASFSDGIKTSKGTGNVVVKNWATYLDKGGSKLTTAFEWDISDRIPAIVVSAIFNPGSCDRNVGPCNDQVVITLSEPVQKAEGATDDRSGNLPTLAAPFQYRLVNDARDGWYTYAQGSDLPATRNSRSNIIWRPSTGQVEPEGQRDSIVAIAYTYSPGVNTPLRGDSVKFAYNEYSLVDLAPAETVDEIEVFAGGNRPNPKERGRKFVGEISITTGKIPIGEVNPELCPEQDSEKCRSLIVEKILDKNPGFSEKQKDKIRNELFKDGVTDYLPVLDGWTADSVARHYPGTVGIIIRPDVVSKGVGPENISFYASAFYHTNLGNYVVETAPLRELKCNDDIFPNSNCAGGNGTGIYLAWNMRDAKNRWAGAGAYVEVYDFYWEIKNSGELNGTFDKMSKKIEMLGVKRTKKK